MKPRDPTYRHRIVVPGSLITGFVSCIEIEKYLRATGWRDGLLGVPGWPSDVPLWFVRGSEKWETFIPSPRDEAFRIESVFDAIAQKEGRIPGDVLRRIEATARGRSIEEITSRRELLDSDLSDIAEEIDVLLRFPGLRPWDIKTLWRAVLNFGLVAEKSGEAHEFVEALGAMKVLDLLDKKHRRW